ncbi:NUDIX domain-containing protein [Phytohabitans kaempferiae]|uniref:NUDIX domain-containing protein n=1 Tax=Phytohabitans kaempferiae TaxID=1620943 RepID=A0ABV6MDG6_9ACTN
MTVEARFCPRCGAGLRAKPPTTCAACGYALFVNARPTANLIVHDGHRFLALKRAMEPRAGLWETPGGFCDGWEDPATAAVREGREELGVEVTLGEFVGMYVGSYDYQGERLPVLDCFFLATLDGAQVRLDPRESADLAWFDLERPPPLAFETMDRALSDAASRLGR